MSRESVPIPVEYIITTTSDWTNFHIVEGGSWTDGKIECLKGCDRLKQAVFEDNVIVIKKVPQDITLVKVRATCTLNIDKKYLDSEISHLITKGDLNSTTVEIIIQGKEIESKANSENIEGKSENPMPFNVPASQYVSAFKKLKRKIDYNELETRVANFKKYERLFSFFTDYWFLAILILLMVFAVVSILIGRPVEPLETYLIAGLLGSVWVFSTHVTRKRVKKYKVEDDEWAIFYTHSIMNNLERYSETDNIYRKNDFRKKAVRFARDFLSCIEKRWEIGRFKLARDYFGKPLLELNKNIQYRIIPSLKDEDDKTLEKIEQIMRNFLMESRSLNIEGISRINKQMSSRLNEIKSIGYRDRLSTLLSAHKALKHGLVIFSFAVGCGFFYYIVVIHGDIPKEYAFTGTVAGFLGLLTIYFRKQPRE